MQLSKWNDLLFTSNVKLMTKTQHGKTAKHPFVFVSCFKHAMETLRPAFNLSTDHQFSS